MLTLCATESGAVDLYSALAERRWHMRRADGSTLYPVRDGKEAADDEEKPHASRLLHLHHRTLARLYEAAVCARAALRWADGAQPRTPFRPTQGRRQARSSQTSQVRDQAAARSDDGDRSLLNAEGRRESGKGRRGSTGGERASSVLGLKRSAYRPPDNPTFGALKVSPHDAHRHAVSFVICFASVPTFVEPHAGRVRSGGEFDRHATSSLWNDFREATVHRGRNAKKAVTTVADRRLCLK